ncbi:MAG: hypothetical protein QM768_21740 [Agriterribacter sp.]
MESQAYYSQFYPELIERIAFVVPELRWIDQDYSQLEHYNERPAVQFPCALIDFVNTTFDQLSQLVVTGSSLIQIRLAFAPFSQSSNTAPQMVLQKALNYYNYEEKLFQGLHGWMPKSGICQPLSIVSQATERRDDNIRVRLNTFSTAFDNTGAKKKYTSVPRPELIEEYYQSP